MFTGADHAVGEPRLRASLCLPGRLSRLHEDGDGRLQASLPELPLQLRLEPRSVRRPHSNEGRPTPFTKRSSAYLSLTERMNLILYEGTFYPRTML